MERTITAEIEGFEITFTTYLSEVSGEETCDTIHIIKAPCLIIDFDKMGWENMEGSYWIEYCEFVNMVDKWLKDLEEDNEDYLEYIDGRREAYLDSGMSEKDFFWSSKEGGI